MSEAGAGRGGSPFSRGGIFAVIAVGFAAFLAMLYFIGAGDTGDFPESGAAHASSNGLNGYSGFIALLEAEGYDVERSRGRSGLETSDLLILTPPPFTDPQELATVLNNRQYFGPTMVILPKWTTFRPQSVPEEVQDEVREDWVRLAGANALEWTEQLPAPFTFTHVREELDDDQVANFQGLGRSGVLPTKTVLYAEQDSSHEAVMRDGAGHILAFNVVGDPGTDYYDNAHWVMFVVEPDLVNNYGLADGDRAAAALALVREVGYNDMDAITVDMTFNGYGNSTNLLTLAFQPPFLAATLCLLLAMVIVGWRAFHRFGPAAARKQDIPFGKRRLVANGAGLIVRAKRLGLLAEPYIHLMERRVGRMLGLTKPDPDSIDAALARRLPDEEPFSSRAARLYNAAKPLEILRAAQALNDLTNKLSGKLSR